MCTHSLTALPQSTSVINFLRRASVHHSRLCATNNVARNHWTPESGFGVFSPKFASKIAAFCLVAWPSLFTPRGQSDCNQTRAEYIEYVRLIGACPRTIQYWADAVPLSSFFGVVIAKHPPYLFRRPSCTRRDIQACHFMGDASRHNYKDCGETTVYFSARSRIGRVVQSGDALS